MPLPAAASPGPAAYRPCCTNGCCDACEKYNGKSFGLRWGRRFCAVGPLSLQVWGGLFTLLACVEDQVLVDPYG